MHRLWHSFWSDYVPSIVGYAVLAFYLLGPPAVFIVGYLWFGTGFPSLEVPELDPSAPLTRKGCPSSEAVEAVTGFPGSVLDGPLANAERGRLAGSWVTARQELWPGPLFFSPPEPSQVHGLAFDGDKCRITFTLQENQPVQQLDLTVVWTSGCDPKGFNLVGPEGNVRSKCIYREKADELTVVLSLDSKVRPTGFRSYGCAVLVLILKRERV